MAASTIPRAIWKVSLGCFFFLVGMAYYAIP